MIEEGFFPPSIMSRRPCETHTSHGFSLEGKMFPVTPNAWHIEAAVMSSYAGTAGT